MTTNIGCYAFVDDSGDIGTRSTSKGHFILGGYFLLPSEAPSISLALADARSIIGLEADQPVHFRNYSHYKKVRLSECMAKAPLVSFVSVLCKRAGPEKRPWKHEHLYNWMIKLVLERASWYFKRQGVLGSVTFAHLKGFSVDKVHGYVEQLKGRSDHGIEWAHLHTPVRFGKMETDERLQAADTIASAAGDAFQGGELGVIETRYFRTLAPTLWREGGTLLSYGLKIHPALGVSPRCLSDDHSWVTQLP